MTSRGVSKTGGAGGGEGGCGSLGGLPCRCHVPQCAPTVQVGQGGDGGIHLITSAGSDKHHPVSRPPAKAPLVVPFFCGAVLSANLSTRRNAITCHHKLLLDLHSQSTLAVHIQCRQPWSDHVHCVCLPSSTGVGTQQRGVEKRGDGIREDKDRQAHSGAEHVIMQLQPAYV